jgi:cell division protein FtsQ
MENKILRNILIALWLVITALLGFYLPTLPFVKELSEKYLSIKEVIILGTERLPEVAIKNYLSTQNWIFLDEKELKNYLLSFSFVKDVEIEKDGLGKIVIRVKERKPIAKIKLDETVFLIGEDGKLMERIYFPNIDLKKLPTVIYNDEGYNPDRTKLIKKIENALGEKYKIKKYIIYRSKIIAILDNNINLAFAIDDLDSELKKAKEFLANVDINNFKSIDFSFQSTVVGRR